MESREPDELGTEGEIVGVLEFEAFAGKLVLLLVLLLVSLARVGDIVGTAVVTLALSALVVVGDAEGGTCAMLSRLQRTRTKSRTPYPEASKDIMSILCDFLRSMDVVCSRLFCREGIGLDLSSCDDDEIAAGVLAPAMHSTSLVRDFVLRGLCLHLKG